MSCFESLGQSLVKFNHVEAISKQLLVFGIINSLVRKLLVFVLPVRIHTVLDAIRCRVPLILIRFIDSLSL